MEVAGMPGKESALDMRSHILIRRLEDAIGDI